MSAAHPAVDHHAEGHNAGHDAGHDASHGSLQGYLTGFVLSAILTAIPFWLAMGQVLPAPLYTALAITILAAAQILVHMVFFLHMNTKSEGGWIMLALIFTLVFVSVTLIGSMWVMYHLNVNMMPMTAQDMRNAP